MGFVSPDKEVVNLCRCGAAEWTAASGRQRGLARGCAVKLTRSLCDMEEVARTKKWPEFEWGVSGMEG